MCGTNLKYNTITVQFTAQFWNACTLHEHFMLLSTTTVRHSEANIVLLTPLQLLLVTYSLLNTYIHYIHYAVISLIYQGVYIWVLLVFWVYFDGNVYILLIVTEYFYTAVLLSQLVSTNFWPCSPLKQSFTELDDNNMKASWLRKKKSIWLTFASIWR